MRKHVWNLRNLSFLVVIIFASLYLKSCKVDDEGTTNPVLTGNGIVQGKVMDVNGNGMGGVLVSSGIRQATTNALGIFELTEVAEGNRGLINFSKDGFVSTQKIVKVVDLKKSYTEAVLWEVGITKTINTDIPQTVSTDGVKVKFQANAIVDSKGNAYSGNAEVRLTYFDPTHSAFFDAFPGEFKGVEQSGAEVDIVSFGFIDVEIFNGSEKLQLADGKPAEITMPLPAAFAANAPASMPLWFYDNDKGKWMEYSVATKTGDEYIGEVTHFTRINLDMKFEERSEIGGTIVDQDGNTLSEAWVKLSGVDFAGGGTGTAGPDGKFSFYNVKANAEVEITAYYGGFYSTPLQTSTPGDGQLKDLGNIEIFIDPDQTSAWTELSGYDGREISDMQFIDANDGWATAGNKILYTYDGGASWTMQLETGQGNDSTGINAIHVIDGNSVWAISSSKVYRTSDGGTNWADAGLNGDYYSDIFFTDVNNGWIAGSSLLRTTDGGANWDTVSTGQGQKEGPSTIFFADANNGWSLGWEGIEHTTDGGESWTIQGDGTIYNGGGSMFFIDQYTGWVVINGIRGSDSRIYYTDDGGTNWTEQTHSAIASLNSVFFTDSNNGWIAGDMGTILRTTNGGSDWTPQFTGLNDRLNAIWMLNNDIGWAAGGNYSEGIILYTETGGD